MSEPIPEAIPTSTSRLSHRPTKRSKSHHGNTAVAAQSHSLAVLFANADREIVIPASSTAAKTAPAPPPEIVPNVQGSSAGAGSGEFHVYKASRRREYERLKAMDEEVKREEDDREWERKKIDNERKEEKRMSKNRARREKAKERKSGMVKSPAAAGDENGDGDMVVEKAVGVRKRDLPVLKVNGEGGDVPAETNGAEAAEEVGLTIHDDED